jgi:hypothetical protein
MCRSWTWYLHPISSLRFLSFCLAVFLLRASNFQPLTIDGYLIRVLIQGIDVRDLNHGNEF